MRHTGFAWVPEHAQEVTSIKSSSWVKKTDISLHIGFHFSLKNILRAGCAIHDDSKPDY